MTVEDDTWLRVATVLADSWAFPVIHRELLPGGRNARTWRVTGPTGTAVAKLVEPGDANLDIFEQSLRVATLLDRPDLPTAAPLPDRGGRLVVPVGAGRLALLPWLSGAPLSGTADADLERMGMVLASLHRRAAGITVPPAIPMWPWSWLNLRALGLEPLYPEDADLVQRAANAPADPRPLGLLHGDPTPDSFLADGATVAVIDWASVMHGPLRYDLAVLVLAAERAGARPDQIGRLVASYDAAVAGWAANVDDAPGGTTTADGLPHTRDLAGMRALRLAAEIVYFTARLRRPAATQVDAAEDLAGLARAREALRELV